MFLAGLLLLATAGVYARAGGLGLVYDDRDYLTGNPQVLGGLTRAGIAWAFTAFHSANWHPLTWLSLMADVTFFGGSSAAHHLVNVLFHGLNVALLFLVLRRLTGKLWQSAFAAALLAVHPLHVESVAWVTERKDVLSLFMMLLALGAYLRYLSRPGAARYLALAAVFLLGLSAKPMLVSFPVVLLLLDFWPLDRFVARPGGTLGARLRPVVLEKLPLLALSAASAVITIRAQQQFQAMQSLLSRPLAERAANALVSYAKYLGKAIWPSGLAAVYPYERFGLLSWQVGLALLLLAGVTAFAFAHRRRRPYLAAGWLWYLVTLVPVIGIVQVGNQPLADRYTYLPLIGISVALAWLAADLTARLPRRGPLLAAAVCLTLAPLAALTVRQITCWQDEQSLYGRAIAVTGPNERAEYGLAYALVEAGRMPEAIPHLREALRLRPRYAEALDLLGLALENAGETPAARRSYEQALLVDPRLASAHVNLGLLIARSGRRREAIQHYRAAIALDPGREEAQMNLGNALDEEGLSEEAVGAYRAALSINPRNALTHFNLGITLRGLGRREEAAAQLREALRWGPEFPEAQRALAGLGVKP
jgi:tetratricopeptide (TPR) repeat protein